MTMTSPPTTPGSRRTVPHYPRPGVVDQLRRLVAGRRWVLRPAWDRYLAGEDDVLVPIDHLTRDQRLAAIAWLRQQRHRLYATLEGGEAAPAGWLADLPLYQALNGGIPGARRGSNGLQR